MTDSGGLEDLSPFRLRLGIVFLVIFWFPVWLAEPAISKILGVKSASGHTVILISIIIFQGLCLIIGVIIVGRSVVTIVKTPPKRKVIVRLWNILIHGKVDLKQK
jgi:hypothetical protein